MRSTVLCQDYREALKVAAEEAEELGDDHLVIDLEAGWSKPPAVNRLEPCAL